MSYTDPFNRNARPRERYAFQDTLDEWARQDWEDIEKEMQRKREKKRDADRRSTEEDGSAPAAGPAVVEPSAANSAASESAERHATKRQRQLTPAQLEQQAKYDAWKERRAQEVARCARVNPHPEGWWFAMMSRNRGRLPGGWCTNNRCETRRHYDFCGCFHHTHDLPPHCKHLPNCRNGERCWYNHLPEAEAPDFYGFPYQSM